MPVKSGKQFRAMKAAKHGKSTLGIPKRVAEEFIKETPRKKRRKFAKQKRPKTRGRGKR